MKHSKLAFVSVGIFSAGVHYGIAVSTHFCGLSPANANWTGFMVAFPISYYGHRKWSFPGSRAKHVNAFMKSFLIALTGMLVNQSLLAILMKCSGLPFWLALGMVDAVVSVGSWILNRFWAFHHK